MAHPEDVVGDAIRDLGLNFMPRNAVEEDASEPTTPISIPSRGGAGALIYWLNIIGMFAMFFIWCNGPQIMKEEWKRRQRVRELQIRRIRTIIERFFRVMIAPNRPLRIEAAPPGWMPPPEQVLAQQKAKEVEMDLKQKKKNVLDNHKRTSLPQATKKPTASVASSSSSSRPSSLPNKSKASRKDDADDEITVENEQKTQKQPKKKTAKKQKSSDSSVSSASAAPSSSALIPPASQSHAPIRRKRPQNAAIHSIASPDIDSDDEATGGQSPHGMEDALYQQQQKQSQHVEQLVSLSPEELKELLFSKCRHNRFSDVKSLLERHPAILTPDIRDSFGNTPLIVACQNGHKKVAKLLFKAGSDVNAVNHRGTTALYYCQAYSYQSLSTYLLSKGAVALSNSPSLPSSPSHASATPASAGLSLASIRRQLESPSSSSSAPFIPILSDSDDPLSSTLHSPSEDDDEKRFRAAGVEPMPPHASPSVGKVTPPRTSPVLSAAASPSSGYRSRLKQPLSISSPSSSSAPGLVIEHVDEESTQPEPVQAPIDDQFMIPFHRGFIPSPRHSPSSSSAASSIPHSTKPKILFEE